MVPMLTLLTAAALGAEPAPVLTQASAELDRVMGALADAEDPPYFLAYGIVDTHSIHIVATEGTVDMVEDEHHRVADIDVRIGSPALDNTHKILDASWLSEEMRSRVQLPVDDPKGKATQTLRSVKGSDGVADIARLWIVAGG